MQMGRIRIPILALLAANAFSQLGNTLTLLAIPWFVLETTGSASRTGIAAAVGTIPVVLVGLVGGAIIDRLGFRQTSIISDIASGATIVLIPLLHLTVGIEFWQLLVLIFLGAVLDMPGITARRSIYPDLAQMAGYRLERANASYQLVNRMAQLLGPPLAGVLIVSIGASNVLWVTGMTFAVSSLLVAVGIPKNVALEDAEVDSEPKRYVREVVEGFQFIWTERTLFWMIVLMSVGSLIAEPLYSVILPVYAREVFGTAVGLGIAFSGLALGSIAGNLLYAWRGYRLSRRLLVIGGFAGRAVTFWFIVTQPSILALAALLFLSGVMLEPANPIYQTILQERVPSRMRGRVFAAAAAIGMGTMPIGMIAYGFVLDWVGLQTTLIILAAVNLLLPVLMLLTAPLRHMESAASVQAVSETAS
jgi:MFS family permease